MHDERLLTAHLSFLWNIAGSATRDTFELGRMFYGSSDTPTSLDDLVEWGYVQDITTEPATGTMRFYKLTQQGEIAASQITRHYNDYYWSDSTWHDHFMMCVHDAIRIWLKFKHSDDDRKRYIEEGNQVIELAMRLTESDVPAMFGTNTLRDVARELVEGVFKAHYLPEWVPQDLRRLVPSVID